MRKLIIALALLLSATVGAPAANKVIVLGGGVGIPLPIVNGECLIGSGGKAVWGACSGAGTAVTSVTGTAGQVTVSPTTGDTIVSLPATITKNLTFSGSVTLNGALSGTGLTNYLASPAAIGGTVAAAGTFTTLVGTTVSGAIAATTLSASSTVSGAGFSTYLASPPAIGGTTAAAGTFTTLDITSVLETLGNNSLVINQGGNGTMAVIGGAGPLVNANVFRLTAAAAASSPLFAVTGSDTDVSMTIAAQGAGNIIFSNPVKISGLAGIGTRCVNASAAGVLGVAAADCGTGGGSTTTVPNGGTGQTTLTNHGVLVGAGTSAITQLSAAAAGTLLTGQGASADPVFSATPVLGIAGTTLGTLGFSGNTSGVVTVQPAAAAGTWSLTLPIDGGSSGQFLQTNGSGVATWASPAGGGTVNAGTAGQMTYYATSAAAVSGNANATISNGALTLGVSTSVLGQLILAGNTSGAITISPQAAAGTYNFNLPTGAGTAGQALLSGGGGASAMTFGTLGVAAGGTGQVTLTSHGVLVGAGTSAVGQLTAAAAGTLLTGQGAGADPSFSATPTLGVTGATKGTLAFAGNTSGLVTVQPAAAAGTWSFTWPTTGGTANYALITNGSGVSSWSILPVAGGGTNAATASGTALDNITGFSSTGFLTRTGAGTYAFQSLTNGITLGNMATIADQTVIGNGAGSTTTPVALALGNGLTASATALNLIFKDITKTTSYQVAATDMGYGINLSGSGATLTLPAVTSTIFSPGMSLSVVNTGTGNWTLTNSTGLTTAGLTSTTLPPGFSGTFVANNDTTHLDFFPGAQFPTTTLIGGVLSSSAASNQFATGISTAGAVTYAQPAFTNISGAVTAAQMLALTTGNVYQGNGSNQAASVTLSAAIDAAIGSTQGSVLYRGATAWNALGPGTTGQFLKTLGAASNPTWASVSATGCAPGGVIHDIVTDDGAGGCTSDTSATVNAGALLLGASGTLGSVELGNATSGTVKVQPVAGALGSKTIFLPVPTGSTDTAAVLGTAQTWSAAQLFNAATLTFGNASSGVTTIAGASSASNFTATFPANSGTVAELNLAQTWSALQGFNDGDLGLNGSGSGQTVLKASATGGGTATFFAGSATVAGLSIAETFSATQTFNASGSIILGANSGNVGSAKFFGNTSGDVTVAAAAAAGTSTIFTLPATNGTAGYVLSTNGSGVTSWAATTNATLLATGTSVSLTAPREYYVCTGTCTVTPPTPAAGYEFCVMNDDNVATVITLAAIASVSYEATARTSYGTANHTFTSGGAAADKICIVGRDSTHYLTVSFNGTWTLTP